MVIVLQLEKETKNTLRYQAVEDDAAVQTLYVQKDALAGQPAQLRLTVEEV